MVEKGLRIGVVKPTFTGAAYSGFYNYSTGFYAFFHSPSLNHKPSPPDADYYNYLPYPPYNYHRYSRYNKYLGTKDLIAKAGKLGKQNFVPITDHLEMLSPKIPTTPEEIKHLDELYGDKYIGEEYNPYRVTKIVPHIKEILPDSDVVVLTDGDIHDGEASNFDILILGHNEYVTQQEYDNLKNFVANGGILVCLNGNVFFCEVSYDKEAQTVTLVRGHHWVFDGEKAYWYKPEKYFEDSGERWQEETSEWLGSNYVYSKDIAAWRYGPHEKGFVYILYNKLVPRLGFIYGDSIEDQYITNFDGVKIIQDWGAKSPFPDAPFAYGDIHIACYEKPYLRGKSIVFGFYSDRVIDNPEFLKFFDGVLLGNAIASLNSIPKCNLSRIIKNALEGKEDTIKWLLNTVDEKEAALKRVGGEVEMLQNINLDHQRRLKQTLNTVDEKEAALKRVVREVEMLQNINLNHQTRLKQTNDQLEQAVKSVSILQGINLGHQKTIKEKDDKIKSTELEVQKLKRQSSIV